MNKKMKNFGRVGLVGLVGLCAALLCGCASSPQRVAFNLESTAAVTVDTAMGAWGDYVRENHPPADKEAKVKAAYQSYQAAMVAVIDATQAAVSLAAAGSTNLTTMQAEVARATAAQQASKALAELVELIRTFGIDPSRFVSVKPKP